LEVKNMSKINENEIKKIEEQVKETENPVPETPDVPEVPETKVVEVKKNPVEKFVENCYAKRVQKAEKKAEKQVKKAAEAEQPKEKGTFGKKLRKAVVPAAIGLTVLGGAAVKMMLRGSASTCDGQSGEDTSVEEQNIPESSENDPAVSE
jgi:hypothetical protein